MHMLHLGVADVNGVVLKSRLFKLVCGSGVLLTLSPLQQTGCLSLSNTVIDNCLITLDGLLANKIAIADINLDRERLLCSLGLNSIGERREGHCRDQHDCYQQQAEQLFAKCLHFVFLLIDWNK